MIHDLLTRWAEARGFRLAAADAAEVEEARAELERRRESGELSDGHFRDNLSGFTYLRDCGLENPRSVIVAALPRPAHVLTFTHDGKEVDAVLPPTYVRYRGVFADVRDELNGALAGTAHRVGLIHAPLKILAERLGLISYGRNNIGYIDGLGSAFQLVGLASDILPPPSAAKPAGRALLPRCRSCTACIEGCPRGAIGRGRFLLRAEKCYTLASESVKPIPRDVAPPSPECLVGCLRCQEVCPENEGRIRTERLPVSFDAEETAAFLGLPGSSPAAGAAAEKKLSSLGLSEDRAVYVRNLSRILGLGS